MPLRIIRGVINGRIYFFFMAECYFIALIYPSFFLHFSPIDIEVVSVPQLV